LALLPAIIAIALLIAWKTGYFDLDRRQALAGAVDDVRALPGSSLLFVLIFAVAVALCFPANAATWLAGAMFGTWLGAAVSYVGGLVATVVGYWLARRLARRPIERLFSEHRLLHALKKRDDIPTLFQLRVLPVAPFAVLTYVAGIAGVSLRKLLLATVIGGIPACIAHAFVGTQLMQGLSSSSGDAKRALLLAGGVTAGMLLVSLIVGIVRRNSKAH
jgi:phospholipase D1/2